MYQVQFHPELSAAHVYQGVDILWSENPLIREQHPFLQYRALLMDEVLGQQGLVCTCSGIFVGALVIGELSYDSHFPGAGVVVYYSVTSRFHPQATLALYRALSDRIRQAGGQWYQTTRRLSATEFQSKYRRIHG